ncbi:ScpA family protein [Corynebacterium sp. HS2168-gen11]|uniref:segregation and condensation protein A n=1 Tax=Corynebacterium sp. HS2168-gen11 TaxID=2974027 RepID=UPI00216B032C|nr:segregation/condensation protein A [Corynebacterium sp. HS2168-gen11]MCS4535033.1 segregation/condensation protein A [Corynebacterium sp. HS2168-gen11]
MARRRIPVADNQPEITGFRIVLHNFEGPFDLLLHLIGSKKLDVTEVALAQVTDDFVAYTKQLGEFSALDEVTEFLVVAATLLELKAARLLPRDDDQLQEDWELLETQDLLFARLLQYKAYKDVADLFATWQRQAQRGYPRAVSLEPQFAKLLPPVTLGHDVHSFAELAAGVFRPQPPPTVATSHVHQVVVSVPEQAGKILTTLELLGAHTWIDFVRLTKDCTESMHVIGRFLALLELYKAKAIALEQTESLGELKIAWTGLSVDPHVVAASTWE